MNGVELLRHSQNPEADNYIQSEIVGGVGGVALGIVGSSVGADVFSIGGGLAGVLTSKVLQGDIDKLEATKLLNGLASFGKSLAAIGAANLLLPGSGFFQILLSALGLVIAGDTLYYVGRKSAGKVKAILDKRNASEGELSQGGNGEQQGESMPVNKENAEISNDNGFSEDTKEDSGDGMIFEKDGELINTDQLKQMVKNGEIELKFEVEEVEDDYEDKERSGDVYQFFAPVTIRV